MKQSELAAALGVSRGTVCRAVARGMPTDSAEAARAWRAEHVNGYRRAASAKSGQEGGDDGANLARERAALARAQREGIEIKNAALRGEYAKISLLADVLATASAAVAERLDGLPAVLRRRCRHLSADGIAAVVAVIAEARNEWVYATAELVRQRVTVPDNDDDDDDAAALA